MFLQNKQEDNGVKKILFIQPSFSSLVTLQKIIDGRDPRDFSEAHYTFPIGLLHIASMLEKHNYDVRILDLDKKFYTFLHSESKNKDLTKFLEKYLVRFVSEYNPDIVGISGNFNINKSFVTECCKKLKEFDKELPIVLGGHYPTNCYEEILENDNNVDFIVLGEGEAVMLQLVNALDSGNVSNIERHPSIVVKNGNEQGGKIKKTSAKVGNLVPDGKDEHHGTNEYEPGASYPAKQLYQAQNCPVKKPPVPLR